MIFRDINTKFTPDNDATMDTLPLWVDKLQDNFDNLQRWFGEGVLDGGAPDIYEDTTGITGTISFTSPIKGMVQGCKDVTFDSTNMFRPNFGWQFNEYWILNKKDRPTDAIYGSGTWIPNPVYNGQFVYFFEVNRFYRYDTQRINNYWSDHSKGWESIESSRVFSGTANGAVIEGDYIYFAPSSTNTVVRYNTTLNFRAETSWEKVREATLNYKDLGESVINFPAQSFRGATSDGQFIYFAPYESDSFFRFNHALADRRSLTYSQSDTTCWQWVGITKVRPGIVGTSNYWGCEYDPLSECVYFAAFRTVNSTDQGLMRFNRGKQERYGFSFYDATCWENANIHDALGTDIAGIGGWFSGVVRKGHFMYFQPERAAYFLRFDTRKYWDSTAAYNADTTTGFEWVIRNASNLGPNTGTGDAWYWNKPAQDGRYIYWQAYNNQRLTRFDTTSGFTTDAVRRRAVWCTTDPTAWENIPSSRVISHGFTFDSTAIKSYDVFKTSGAVRAGNYIYYQPNSNYSGTDPKVMVRFNINGAFDRGQDEPYLIGLNEGADLIDYNLKHYTLNTLTSAIDTEGWKKFTDTTRLIPLWVVIHDDQRGKITRVYDIRNVIPTARNRINEFQFKGLGNSPETLPLVGNRNGDVYVIKSLTGDDRTIWIWNEDVTPGTFSRSYWHPMVPGGISQYVFQDIRFEGPGGELRGLIGADNQTDIANFSAGDNIDWGYVNTPTLKDSVYQVNDRRVTWNVKINKTLDMHGHNIENCANIDSTGDFQITGTLSVDGTTIIYGNVDATNVVFERTLNTHKTIIEDGRFNLGQVVTLIDALSMSEGDITVSGKLDITGTLSVTGTIDGINFLDHHYRHEVHPAYVASDGTGVDLIDATNLAGILVDPHNCEWIQKEDISTNNPNENETLRYISGEWIPDPLSSIQALTFEEKMAIYRIGMNPDAGDAERLRSLLFRMSIFTDAGFWENTSVDVAGTIIDGDKFDGICFDGKYIYYTPFNEAEFQRYDTDENFDEENAWHSFDLGYGGHSFAGNPCFDGRYIYFSPYNSETFVRFDTQGYRRYSSADSLEDDFTFSVTENWEFTDQTHALQPTDMGVDELPIGKGWRGCVFDGRYVYYVPYMAKTVVRFDTKSGLYVNDREIQLGSFAARNNWKTVDIEEAIDHRLKRPMFSDAVFDGQSIYFGAYDSTRLVRFNTRGFIRSGSNFSDGTGWDSVSIWNILGHVPTFGPYYPSLFTDGKWIYYAPDSTSQGTGSVDGTTIIRFNTYGSFSEKNSWETIGLDHVLPEETGWRHRFSRGMMFDGKWIYISPDHGKHFLRYNIDENFQIRNHTDTTGWENILFTDIEFSFTGGRLSSGIGFDGKYLYFAPTGISSFLRFQGLNSGGKYGMR